MIGFQALNNIMFRLEKHESWLAYVLWPFVMWFFFIAFNNFQTFLYALWSSNDSDYLNRYRELPSLCWRILERLSFNYIWIIYLLFVYILVLLFGQLFKHHKFYYKCINLSFIMFFVITTFLMINLLLTPLGAVRMAG